MATRNVNKKKTNIKERKGKYACEKQLSYEEKRQKRNSIKSGLLKQLDDLEMYSQFYIDLIDDYMFYYDLKEKMQRDIRRRGLVITVTTGNGFEKKQINDNVKELRETSKMMLKILQDLNLREPTSIPDPTTQRDPTDEELY